MLGFTMFFRNFNVGTLMGCSLAVSAIAFAQSRITVASKDGVPISVIKLGSGPPMVLVHGSASVGLSWAASLPALSRNFTIYAMDRRGRGKSGDGSQYSVQAEVDDIAAVIAAAGQPVTLVAHSYGAFLATVGAAQDEPIKNVSRMILYEPPAYEKPRPEHAKMTQEMAQAAEAGDKDRVTAVFLEGVMGTQALKVMQGSPGWPSITAMAGTLQREADAVNDYRIPAAALGKWKIPTTMLVGELSPDFMRAAAQYVCASMANCKLVVLEGQSHMAAQQAPALFVAKVLEASGQ